MKVKVNKKQIELFDGATVIDALRAYYSSQKKSFPKKAPTVTDRYGNKVALDGALTSGSELIIKPKCKLLSKLVKKQNCWARLAIFALCPLLLASHSAGFLSSCTSKQEKTVVILAVNDMHATLDNFPRFAFIVDSLRAIYPDMLLISGGDNQTGNPVNDQHPQKGSPIIELMNAAKFDLSAIGNHEFDTKPDGLANNINSADFDFICTNIETPADGKFDIKPYKIIAMPNGVKVGFLSILHINSNGIPDSHPDNVGMFKFKDPIQTAKEHLHLQDSCDLLIFVNHYGFENDVALAMQLPVNTVDLIIGGHSHTKVDKDQIHNGIMITQAENKLKYATLIQFSIKPKGETERTMQLLTVGRNGNECAKTHAMIDEYNNNSPLNDVIATALDNLTSVEQLGYLLTDALRANTKTDVALINHGGVRTDYMAKGPICSSHIYTVDPFGNSAVIFKLNAAELRALIMEAYTFDEYRYTYPSGIRIKYLVDENDNLKDVKLFSKDGKPLNPNDTFTVAINSYMASSYQFEHKNKGTGLAKTTAECTIEYLRELKEIPSYSNEKRVEIE